MGTLPTLGIALRGHNTVTAFAERLNVLYTTCIIFRWYLWLWGSAMSAMRQILATKLHAPLPTGLLVMRPRLIAHLDDALRRPLTAVIAPPGFGKTTLVSGWAASVHTRGQASVA